MMLSTIILFPGLPGAVSLALRALLWAVALLAALALVVGVLVAVAPYLPQLMVAMSVVMAYSLLTMPRTARKAVRNAR